MINIRSIGKFINRQPPARIIAVGFAGIILFGAMLFMMPFTHRHGVRLSFTDALFTSAASVCVTGIMPVTPSTDLSLAGQIIMCAMIQMGGLGIATCAVALYIFAGGKVRRHQLSMVKESLNISSYSNLLPLFYKILIVTAIAEGVGAILSFVTFSQSFPTGAAVWISIFHSVSAFNNAGVDIFGGKDSLMMYADNIYFNIVTILLVVIGGIGYFVIFDVISARKFKRLRLNSKIILTMTIFLIILGTFAFRFTEKMSWLCALFQSVTCRTAGFATYDFAKYSSAGLFTAILLMFIGSSPGSTSGGIKTTTFFTLLCASHAAIANRPVCAFRRKIPDEAVRKAFIVFTLSVLIVCFATILMCLTDSQNPFIHNFFMAVAAYSTAGPSIGIHASLSVPGKMIMIVTMYIGRISVPSLLTLNGFNPRTDAVPAEETIIIG